MRKQFKDLTDADIEIMKRSELTNKEICELTGIPTKVTLTRWKRRLGIVTKQGSKKGKPKPSLVTGQYLPCIQCKTVNVWYRKHELDQGRQKCCSRQCLSKNENFKQKLSEAKRKSWKSPSNSMISGIEKRKKSDLAEFKVYSGKVRRLTEKVYSTHKSLINPNDYPRTLAGVDGGYHLDHIMTVKFGFENNIPIETMCEKENLRMLPWKENISRSRKYKGDVS